MTVLTAPRKFLAKPTSAFLANPVSTFPDFFDNGFFDSPWMRDRFVPAVNIIEDKKHFIFEMAAPGLKKEDFHINFENGMLNIWADLEKKDEMENDNYIRREYNYYSFNRSFAIPEFVDEKMVEAKYENGLLRVYFPKLKGSKPEFKKEIKVK